MKAVDESAHTVPVSNVKIRRRKVAFRWFIVAMVCFGCGAAMSPGVQAWYYGAGRLIPKQGVIDVYPEKDPQAHSRVQCEFFNPGGEPLTILKVTTSCGCTVVAPATGTIVMPRSSFVVNAVAKPADVPTTKVSALGIMTDSPITPQVTKRLNIHGRKPEVPYVYRSPRTVYLSRNNDKNTLETEVVIQSEESSDREPWIKGLQTGIEGLKATPVSSSVIRNIGGGVTRREYRWQLHAPLRMAHELRRGLVQIETSYESRALPPIE